MYRKIFISFLLLALINFLAGCYSAESITVSEYKQVEKEDKPDEIYVKTKDSEEYHFSESNFYIENDTLYGKGKLILDKEQPLDRKIAISNIAWIEVDSINWLTTSLFTLGILVGAFILFLVIAYASGATKHWGG